MDVLLSLWESFHNVCVYQIIMLYSLNILQCCQLYLNKAAEQNQVHVEAVAVMTNREVILNKFQRKASIEVDV